MRGSRSLRQLNFRRTLQGWVVLTRDERLALNYGPTICGRGWGFDWLNRATVFPDKTAACKALKYIGEEETRRVARVVRVSSVAAMYPSVNKRGETVWHAGDKSSPLTIKDHAKIWNDNAKELLSKAQRLTKRAAALRRNADKLLKSPV